MIARRVEQAVGDTIAALSTRRFVTSPLVIVILGSVFVGVGSGLFVSRMDAGDQVVIGNTGGTLSAVIKVGGSIIVVGGGNARSDLADLVGRSTVPWNRHIDLLIVPGWDDQQPIGALGLIERGNVGQIVIVGQPADGAVWTAFEQVAARGTIPVSVVSGHNVVTLTPDSQIELLADEPGAGQPAQYSVVSLHYHQSLVTLVDASKDGATAMSASGVAVGRVHLLVAMRPLTSVSADAGVLLQPRATTASDVTVLGAQFSGEIRSGQHVAVRLSQSELRLPLDSVTAVSTVNP